MIIISQLVNAILKPFQKTVVPTLDEVCRGAIPCGDGVKGPSSADTLKRIQCCLRDHQPRYRDGSWCQGFEYVCNKCHMYVGPWSMEKTEKIMNLLNRSGADQGDLARICGGGPP